MLELASGSALGLRERNKSRTRLAIEEAAWALFADRGYDAVTLAEVAERADVGLRTVYRYFPHKELLLDGDEGCAQEAVAAALSALPPDAPLSEMVRAATRAAVAAKGLEHSREQLRARLAATSPALAARELTRIAGRTAIVSAQLAERLGAGAPGGGDLRSDVLAEAIMGAVRSARRRWLADPTLDPLALVDEAMLVIAPALDAAEKALLLTH